MTERESRLPPPEYVSLNGTDVATYVLEPETDAEAGVVFCHGTPWSAEVWAAAARYVSRNYQVYLWDMPGYGRSEQNDTAPVDLPSQIDRFTGLLQEWGLDRPHVVAHDIGAAVALGSHLSNHDEFASLYLWDPVIVRPWGSKFFRLVATDTEVFMQLPEPLHRALVEAYIAGAAHRSLTVDQLQTLCAPWTTYPGQRAFYRQIASLHPEDTDPIEARLDAVRCRVKIAWGQEDPWIPVSQATVVQNLLPAGVDIVTLAGVGHLAPLELPSAVHRELSAWLGEDVTT